MIGITLLATIGSCALGSCSEWHEATGVFGANYGNIYLQAWPYVILTFFISWALAFTPFIFRGVLVGMLAFFSGLVIYASYMW